MRNNKKDTYLPSWWSRVVSVWFRHTRVYRTNFWSNAFPPFFEPLIFLASLSLGLGQYIPVVGANDFTLFLASGLVVTSAMYTAAFECTYGTYIRLVFDKVYDGMLGAPLSPQNILIGELLFAGTKGMFFSFAVLVVVWTLGIITTPLSIFTVLIGFLAGVLFGSLGLLVTSLVKTINQFNFFFTGLITPMFFFAGVIFPVENLPKGLQVISEINPLTHVVRLARVLCMPGMNRSYFLIDILFCLLITLLFGTIAIKRLSKKMIF